MQNFLAIATATFVLSNPAFAGWQHLDNGISKQTHLHQVASNTQKCKRLKAALKTVKSDRAAYNGNENNWALKDEIRELDEKIWDLEDEIAAAKC